MHAPGYYKTNYRGLRFRELIRAYGWPRGFRHYLGTRFMRPAGGGWMPGLWADTECKPEDLSEAFWQAAKLHRENFTRLGFIECSFQKVTKNLNPLVRDSGGITYLDPSRRHLGRLHYHRIYHRALGREVPKVIISFTAVFENGSLTCTNARKLFDPLDDSKVIRLQDCDVAIIYQQFLRHLEESKETPRSFPDLDSLRQWFDARQVKVFEERAQRRLFIPMTDGEVAAAKARLQDKHAANTAPPRRFSPVWILWLAGIGIVFFLQFFHHRAHGRDDTVKYRGQQFKLRMVYATYEDYKDDPNNLDTNELDRIEQTMASAKIPAAFKNREEFIHFMVFDLEFPGYGMGVDWHRLMMAPRWRSNRWKSPSGTRIALSSCARPRAL
jgi:hypothetical protein